MDIEFASTGIRINGNDSYHVIKLVDSDTWLLMRLRDGVTYQCAEFVSPDEARAFAHCLDLQIDKHNA